MSTRDDCSHFFIQEFIQDMSMNQAVGYYNCRGCNTKRLVYLSHGKPYRIMEGKNMDRYYEDKMVDITTPKLLRM